MTSPSQPTSPSVDAETLKNNLASSLVIAWDRYVSLFGEPPHGTGKQMRSLLSFVPTAALAAPRVEPVAWPNDSNVTVPRRLRTMGDLAPALDVNMDIFSAEQLYALAADIEKMAAQPLYAAPPSQPDTGLARNDPAILRRRIADLEAIIEKSADREAAQPDTGVLREAAAALKPFARAAKQIPDDLPEELWTACSSYEYDMSEEAFEHLKASSVPLLSRKVKLQLWIDGHPLSDFRRAAKVYEALPPDAGSRKPALDPATVEACLNAMPCTAENPNEDAYQRGKFDGVMEYQRAIRALAEKEGESHEPDNERTIRRARSERLGHSDAARLSGDQIQRPSGILQMR
jgi:hypothetical protein